MPTQRQILIVERLCFSYRSQLCSGTRFPEVAAILATTLPFLKQPFLNRQCHYDIRYLQSRSPGIHSILVAHHGLATNSNCGDPAEDLKSHGNNDIPKL